MLINSNNQINRKLIYYINIFIYQFYILFYIGIFKYYRFYKKIGKNVY